LEARSLRKRVLSGLIMGVGALVAAYAFLIEPHWVDWSEEELQIPQLPASLDGLRVCHLSDLHVGIPGSGAFLRRVLDECVSHQPDLIVITGDLLNGRLREIPSCASLLGRLKAPCGVFAILGGHDYRHDPDRLVRSLGAVGVRVLRNEAVRIGPEEPALWLVGLDENSGCCRANLPEAMKRVPVGAPTLLLMHSPDSIPEVSACGVNVALAGHTHGGQVCLPFYGPILTMSRFGRRYARGRRRVRDTILYVSRGIGSHDHIRFLARPEVPLFTLVRAPQLNIEEIAASEPAVL